MRLIISETNIRIRIQNFTESLLYHVYGLESSIQNFNAIYPQITYLSLFKIFESKYIRGLSGKFEDTENTEAKTSNNIKLFLFVLSRTIKQFIYEFSFQSVNS